MCLLVFKYSKGSWKVQKVVRFFFITAVLYVQYIHQCMQMIKFILEKSLKLTGLLHLMCFGGHFSSDSNDLFMYFLFAHFTLFPVRPVYTKEILKAKVLVHNTVADIIRHEFAIASFPLQGRARLAFGTRYFFPFCYPLDLDRTLCWSS